MLQAPWKAVKDISDRRVAPSEKVRLASYSAWFALEEEVPEEDLRGDSPKAWPGIFGTQKAPLIIMCSSSYG